jgi:hypothetical protein
MPTPTVSLAVIVEWGCRESADAVVVVVGFKSDDVREWGLCSQFMVPGADGTGAVVTLSTAVAAGDKVDSEIGTTIGVDRGAGNALGFTLVLLSCCSGSETTWFGLTRACNGESVWW